ncbi:hypothetical protein D3C72_965610 [compost metagenome]
MLQVAVDQRLAAAFALGDHQFGGYALADQIGANGLRPLFGNLQVALAVAQLVGVAGNDDLADVGGVQQFAGDRAQLALAFALQALKVCAAEGEQGVGLQRDGLDRTQRLGAQAVDVIA